jgi:hypothetical protein
MKLIKSYLQWTVPLDRLTHVALLSVENEIASSVNLNNFAKDFAVVK